MTHTIHRRLSQNNDYILGLRSVSGVNSKDSGEKIRNFIKSINSLKPIAYGNPVNGCTLRDDMEKVVNNIKDGSSLHVVFSDEASAMKAVAIAKDMDMGLSVTLTGPLENVNNISSKLDLSIHAVQLDLGTTDGANIPNTTEAIVSMCGHMRISPNLVDHMCCKISSGAIDADTAAREIGKVCRCGCFNTNEASRLLKDGT